VIIPGPWKARATDREVDMALWSTEHGLSELVARACPAVEEMTWVRRGPGWVTCTLRLRWWAYLSAGFLHYREWRVASRVIYLHKPAGVRVDVRI
jgi:hypothetical protein